MRTTKFLLGMFFITALVFFAACDEDDNGDVDPGPLNLTSVTAVGTDINSGEPVTKTLASGSTTANVPIDGVITIVFAKDVDAATANSTNITLTQGSTAVATTVVAAGSVVTLTPTADLAQDTDYTLTLTSAIAGDDGGLFTQTTRAFSTETEEELEEGLIAHWKFEDNADDLTGDFNGSNVIAITYVAGRSGTAGKAASFNGTTSIIDVPNGVDLVTTEDFTLAFWIKVNSDNKKVDGTTPKGYFIMGFNGFRGFQVEMPDNRANTKMVAQYVRADDSKGSEDLWLDATGNLGWQGWTFSEDLTDDGGLPAFVDDEWAHFVYVYDSESKVGSIYLNGELRKSQDFNLWPDDSPVKTVTGLTFNDQDAGVTVPGLGTEFALGFFCSSTTTAFDFATYSNVDHNHFKGELDDVRIYHIAKTEAEVLAQYDAEKP